MSNFKKATDTLDQVKSFRVVMMTLVTSARWVNLCQLGALLSVSVAVAKSFEMQMRRNRCHSVTILFRKVKGSMVSKDLFTQLLFEHCLARFNNFFGQVVTSSG